MKIDDKYKWLARDKNGDLISYTRKPVKKIELGEWFNFISATHRYVGESDDTYSFIKWEDDEPYEISRNKKAIQTVKEYMDSKVEQTKRLDVINKPDHYIGIDGLEVETVLQNFIPKYKDGYVAHRASSAIEYLLRSPEKNGLEDIKKAKQNLEQVIAYVENQVAEQVEEALNQLKGFLIGLSVIGETNKINTFYHGTNPND